MVDNKDKDLMARRLSGSFFKKGVEDYVCNV